MKDYKLSELKEICKGQTNCYKCILSELCKILEEGTTFGEIELEKLDPKKYWAIIGYRNYVGKWGWHIHHTYIEYEKEYNQVAINVDGRLFVTRKDLLFNTESEAKIKLAELEGGNSET